MLTDVRRDLRYALRMLARTSGFTFVICLTLALGIGANAAIFSAVDAVLLRAAPVADPDAVVSVYTGSSDGRDRFSTSGYPDHVDLRDSGVFQSLAAFAPIPLVLQTPCLGCAFPSVAPFRRTRIEQAPASAWSRCRTPRGKTDSGVKHDLAERQPFTRSSVSRREIHVAGTRWGCSGCLPSYLRRSVCTA